MVYIILTLLVTLITLIAAYLHHTYTFWQRRGVQHEKPLIGWGNLKDVGTKISFIDFHRRIYKRFKLEAEKPPPFVGLYFFFSKPVTILNLELIKHILIKDFSNFHDRGVFHNTRDDPLASNLLVLEGEVWRVLRQKLTPVFTSGKMKHMHSTIVTIGENFAQVCAEALAKGQNNSAVLEVKDLCARYTMDVIGSCAFGIECNCLKEPNNIFFKNGRDLVKRPRHTALIQTLMFTMPEMAKKLRLKLLPDDLTEFFYNTVSETVDYRQKNGIHRNDFMDSLIELKAKTKIENDNADDMDFDQGLTMEQIAAQALVFFFAGFETSSTIMTFCVYELAQHLDIQEKLHREIVTSLEENDNKLTYELINNMPYLEMVLSETLRKYPVLPHLIRKCIADYPTPGGYIIPADTVVFVPISAIHYDPEYYPEPDKFDPERFTPEAIKSRIPFTYLPFGDGPRNCIGIRFGRMQAKIGLIKLLQNFKFSTCERTESNIELELKTIVTSPRNGVYLKVEAIAKN